MPRILKIPTMPLSLAGTKRGCEESLEDECEPSKRVRFCSPEPIAESRHPVSRASSPTTSVESMDTAHVAAKAPVRSAMRGARSAERAAQRTERREQRGPYARPERQAEPVSRTRDLDLLMARLNLNSRPATPVEVDRRQD